jgi:hypothetical protein
MIHERRNGEEQPSNRLVEQVGGRGRLRAYYMRLHVAKVEEAAVLVDALRELLARELAVVDEAQSHVVSLLWGERESEDGEEDEWEEQAYAELLFFLRAWSGQDPRREVTVLGHGLVELSEEVFRRAS